MKQLALDLMRVTGAFAPFRLANRDKALVLGDVPAIVEGFTGRAFEPSRLVAARPPRAQALPGKDACMSYHAANLEHKVNTRHNFPPGDGFLSAFIWCMSLAA